MFTRLTFADIYRQELLREMNDCHTPAGSPGGGQFCSSGGITHDAPGFSAGKTTPARGSTDARIAALQRSTASLAKRKEAEMMRNLLTPAEQAQAAAVGSWGRLLALQRTGVTVRPADLPHLKQAAEDWTSGRASATGGRWRVRTERSNVPTSKYTGKATVPTWAKVVKRYFKDAMEFHRFARA